MALTPFPAIPQSSDPPDVFNASVDAFLAHLSTMVFEINTQVGLLSDANTFSALQTFSAGISIQRADGSNYIEASPGDASKQFVVRKKSGEETVEIGLPNWYSLGKLSVVNVVEALGIYSNGDIAVSSGDIAFGTAGKGLSFPAAGGDTLTMYDEGTFTPAVAGASYASRSGSYTRIGNRVFFELNLQMSAQGSSTDTITGLPFTAAAGTVSPVSVGIYTSIGASIVDVRGEVLAGTTSILIRGSNSAATGITLGTLIGSSAIIKVSGSYRV